MCADGASFMASGGTLTFTPGVMTQTAHADILNCGTSSSEGLKTFFFALSSPTNATMARASTRIGIVGNGNATTTPALVVRNAVVDNGAGTVDVPVLLGGPSGTAGTTTVTVDYSTADGTAVAGSDYTATSGTLTFTPGETVENIPVAISGRTGDLPSRNFTVTLSSPTDATIGIGTGTVVIGASGAIPVAMPSISAPPDVIVGSGDGYVDLPVTLSAPGTNTVTAFYQFFNGTAAGGGACADGASFFADQSGTLTFAPGETTKVVRVDILNCGKSSSQGLETFFLDLSSPTNATMARASTRIGIVGNGNATTTPALVVRNAVVDNGAGTVDVPVLLGGPSGTAGTTTVTVDYSTADGTAVAGSDYTATSGTLTFTPGETVENIPVAISGRTGDLPSRNFTVTLSSPTDATIGIGTGTVVIGASGAIPVAMPSISAPPDVIVGSGDGYVDLPVTLSAPGTNTVTAFYQILQWHGRGRRCVCRWGVVLRRSERDPDLRARRDDQGRAGRHPQLREELVTGTGDVLLRSVLAHQRHDGQSVHPDRHRG